MIHPSSRCPKAAAGSVLVLSLWVLFTLSALAVAVSAHVSALVRTADRAQRVERATAAAEAGVALAQVMAADQTNAWDGIVEGQWNTDPELFAGAKVGEASVRIQFEIASEDGPVTNVGLVGCERSINVNASGVELLEAYFSEVGDMSPAVAAKLASAIVEERERRLTPPDDAAGESEVREGAAFRSLYELATVDGIDAELLAELAAGLTVHGSGMINLNASSYDVLRSLFVAVGGESSRKTAERLARRITSLHEAGQAFETATFTDWWDTLRKFDIGIGSAEQALLQKAASRSDIASTCFEGTAVGMLGDAAGAVVSIDFVIDTKHRSVVHWSTR